MEYLIKFTWDAEASVWIATSNDIPGWFWNPVLLTHLLSASDMPSRNYLSKMGLKKQIFRCVFSRSGMRGRMTDGRL